MKCQFGHTLPNFLVPSVVRTQPGMAPSICFGKNTTCPEDGKSGRLFKIGSDRVDLSWRRRMKLARVYFGMMVIVFAVISSLSATADSVDATRHFRGWSTFFADNTCWVATYSIDSEGRTDRSTMMHVSFIDGSTIFEISVITNIERVEYGSNSLRAGDEIYALEDVDGLLFPDENEEEPLFWWLLRGNDVVFQQDNDEAERSHLIFKAAGFFEAYQFVSRECNFILPGRLGDTREREPT